MIRCIFSSINGGISLKKEILNQLDYITSIDSNSVISISIFVFSLTDEDIADKIISISKKNHNVFFRIIADWSQRGIKGNKQLIRLSQSNSDRISVRFKLDQPYIQGKNSSQIKWSYRESWGLLHHKTLSISVNNEQKVLVLGSFNWTKRAIKYYENLLILYPENNSILEVLQKFQFEFDYMWKNTNITSSPFEANNHFQYIKYKLTQKTPEVPIFSEYKANFEFENKSILINNNSILLAFNSRSMNQFESQRGYSPKNLNEKFIMTKPSGKKKSVPLNISNLSLELIYKAKEGDSLKVASYALSSKAVEFGALLEAARRKVNVFILLDKKINKNFARMIESNYTSLPIQIKTTSKRLHSKYIIHENSNSVLTGTANFTIDASKRHTEHRLLFQNNIELTNAFLNDFQTIWERIKKREEDKPRLYLSNNGNDAMDTPQCKYKTLLLINKFFRRFFLFFFHNYLHIRYFYINYLKRKDDIVNSILVNEMLMEIEVKANLNSFDVFLIGSFIDYINGIKENHSTDIDLYISPKNPNITIKYSKIENFILWIRNYGLKHNISFDVVYGKFKPSIKDIKLNSNQNIGFIKIFSPYLKLKVSKSVIKNYKFLGRYLIYFENNIKDTSFYKKLPQSIDNSNEKYLRGAIKLSNIFLKN